LSNQQIEEKQELWTFSHSLSPIDPSVEIFTRSTLYSKIKLNLDQQNWLVTNVLSSNVSDHL